MELWTINMSLSPIKMLFTLKTSIFQAFLVSDTLLSQKKFFVTLQKYFCLNFMKKLLKIFDSWHFLGMCQHKLIIFGLFKCVVTYSLEYTAQTPQNKSIIFPYFSKNPELFQKPSIYQQKLIHPFHKTKKKPLHSSATIEFNDLF